MTRKQVEAENKHMKAQLVGLDRLLRRIDCLADLSCDAMESMIESFADDPPTQARVREVAMGVMSDWGGLIQLLSDACFQPQH